MSRRLVLVAAALLSWIGVGAPACALNAPAPQLQDLYALTKNGTIYRIPAGSSTPQVELTLGTTGNPYDAEWLDFDPASGQFVVGPGLDVAGIKYKRLPQLLTSADGDIPDTDIVGGHGGTVDRFRPPTSGKSDLLLADPTPGIVGVVRIKGDGGSANISTALSVAPQGYSFPEDVEVNWANGDIYVAVQATATLPAAILRYKNDGTFIEKIDVAGGADPFCMVYDNRDAIPYYDLVVASDDGTKQIALIDVDNDRPAGQPRVKVLGGPPAADAACDDLAISPQGTLVYPDFTGGKLYSVDLTTGAATLIADLPQVKSVAFVSRNALASADKGLAAGFFSRTTGPNGRAAILVTVNDPEFSSGLTSVEATGTNLAVDGAPLPFKIDIDPRRERTRFTFVAEKINAAASASIKVTSLDAAGNLGDPPTAMITARSTDTTVVTLALDGLKTRRYRDVYVTNSGVLKMLVEFAGVKYTVIGDPAMRRSGQVVVGRSADQPLSMVIKGWTILRFFGAPATLTITVPSGNPDGAELFIHVD